MDRGTHEHWERLAELHGRGDDRYYDLDRLVAGGTLMGDAEQGALDAAVGTDLTGRSALHLQCHLGCDAITLARWGATVTAVDFSATALERARALAEACGVALTTIEAEATALPPSLNGRFDLVYASIGVLCWIDDLEAWMQGVARVLRPSGVLVLVELHPLWNAVDQRDPLRVDFPYAFDGPHRFTQSGSYANREAEVTSTTVQYGHSLGEVVTAAIDAGLRIERLEEHLSAVQDFRDDGTLVLEDDGRYRLRLGTSVDDQGAPWPAVPLPVLFTLIARRPGGRREQAGENS